MDFFLLISFPLGKYCYKFWWDFSDTMFIYYIWLQSSLKVFIFFFIFTIPVVRLLTQYIYLQKKLHASLFSPSFCLHRQISPYNVNCNNIWNTWFYQFCFTATWEEWRRKLRIWSFITRILIFQIFHLYLVLFCLVGL